MSHKVVGRTLPLSLPRRVICDLIHFGKQIPTVPVQRQMNLGLVREVRANTTPRISWTILFTKAHAMLARDFPVLRQVYMSFPWAYVYEHPESVAAIAVEHDYQGEKVVCGLLMRNAEGRSLAELHHLHEEFRQTPIEKSGHFRKSLLIARFPQFLRRAAWWIGLNYSGAKRVKYFGTFGVSVYSALGAESLHPIAPATTTLNYGIIAPDGSVPVRLIYDHRLMDGATVARALKQMEEILNGPIVEELKASRPRANAA